MRQATNVYLLYFCLPKFFKIVMQLKDTGKSILQQIFEMMSQLSADEYSAELELLNGNSIGKHVRHVLEFFEILTKGAGIGLINYDQRSHSPIFETDVKKTLIRVNQLKDEVAQLAMGKEVFLEVSYARSDDEVVKIKSSVERELAYNIEHAIHHMAIMKIAIQTVFPNVTLPDNFGVAYSTVRYQQSAR